MGPHLPLCVNNFGWLLRESLKHDWRGPPIRQSVGSYLWTFLDLPLVYIRYKTNSCDFSNIIMELSCLIVSVWSLPFKSVFRLCTLKCSCITQYFHLLIKFHKIRQYIWATKSVWLNEVTSVSVEHYKLILLWMKIVC